MRHLSRRRFAQFAGAAVLAAPHASTQRASVTAQPTVAAVRHREMATVFREGVKYQFGSALPAMQFPNQS